MLGLGGGVRTEERPVPVTRGYSQLDAATLRMKIIFCTMYNLSLTKAPCTNLGILQCLYLFFEKGWVEILKPFISAEILGNYQARVLL